MEDKNIRVKTMPLYDTNTSEEISSKYIIGIDPFKEDSPSSMGIVIKREVDSGVIEIIKKTKQ